MIVIAGQSLFDIAIQCDGSIFTIFDWAAANNISITDRLAPGMELTEPVLPANRDIDVANYFFGKKLATRVQVQEGKPTGNEYLYPQTLPLL